MGRHSMDMSGKAKMINSAAGTQPKMGNRGKPVKASGPAPTKQAAEMGSGGLKSAVSHLKANHAPSKAGGRGKMA